MQNSIAFCTETGSHFAYVDYMTHVYNRNALERDLRKLSRDNDSYYIIADLNDLKAVNDAIGHSAGDRVLQAFAGMLVNTAGSAEGYTVRAGTNLLFCTRRRQSLISVSWRNAAGI